ncbi:MAG TPA: serine/threonine-protein kinase, partial [Verrucomicrobiae bacterium]|nr:serine/threonine-protein kinase [Verrucomicrobiae bacterium]
QEDAALAREVRSLLSAHEQASGFLAGPPATPPARGASPGDRLGPYRLVEEIGRGGMGVVFRATRDDGDFTREVAIKLIAPELRSDEVLKRFRAERQILAMLEHPHIARLLDGGTAPDGGPYLVMEFVRGRTLLDYCDAANLGIDQRIALFLQICDAVQFAHQRLVVHRDLKSANILVGEDGSPRLLDFGIAKLLVPEGGVPAATLTLPMLRMLTPDYASPEQVRGEPAAVASDVYSLGVILYELLSGRRPLQFPTRTPEEILRVVTQVDPVPPSAAVTRSPGGEAAIRRGDTTQRLRRRLSGDLDHVALKALEKDPSRRYATVDLLAQDIRRHVHGLPVLARGQATAYRMERFVRRHRAAVAAATLIVVALLIGLAGTTWQASVARRERDRAQRRFDDVRALAHAVVFDIHDAIANLPGSTRARETLVRHALRYLDGLSHEAKGDLSLQHELGVAYAKIGDVQGRPMFPNLGRTADALRSYERSLALLAEVARAQPESVTVVHDLIVVSQRRADLLRITGRTQEAMAEFLRAREQAQAQLARHPRDPLFESDLCVGYGRLIDMKSAAADTAGAIVECTGYLALVERLYAEHHGEQDYRRGVLIACTKMAQVRALRGDRDSVLVFYVRAESLARAAAAALPDNTDATRDLSIVYGAHGLYLAEVGALDSALAVYGKGQHIAEQLAAADPDNAMEQIDVADGHYEIGTMLSGGGRHEQALERFRDAAQRYRRLAAADTGNTQLRLSAAMSCRQAGEACQALSLRVSSAAERARWRQQAIEWLDRSLRWYQPLADAGALVGEDVGAPKAIRARLVALRSGG